MTPAALLARLDAGTCDTRAAAATIRRLSDALRFYRDQFCEGFCDECPATFTSPEMESDCSGCKARAVLAEIEKGTTL